MIHRQVNNVAGAVMHVRSEWLLISKFVSIIHHPVVLWSLLRGGHRRRRDVGLVLVAKGGKWVELAGDLKAPAITLLAARTKTASACIVSRRRINPPGHI